MSILIPPVVSVKQGEVALLMVVRCCQETAVTAAEREKLAWLAANLPHQLNNPLQIIMGALEVYNKFQPFADDSPLKLAHDAAHRLGNVVWNVTQFVQASDAMEVPYV